ncbi:MAG: hypothetical protein KAJ55_09065 [Anaerolineales bacterium]|nr:hypothetical protein [Anaerolineales bacterium]
MTTEIEEARLRKQNEKWTPKEAVEMFLADIISGKIDPLAVAILYHHQTDTDVPTIVPGHYASVMSYAEHIAMLETAKVLCIRRWLGEE